ncbi:MAG: PilZ domain-containing protein [Candidatus Omnitrophica bacterium]|nr:PilZ domain-containing protein [Candidatus Omnitrophota bacterium]
MTFEELKNIKEIIIHDGSKEYRANIVEIPDMVKIIAAPVSTIIDSWMKKPVDIFFTLNDKKYTFSAVVYLPDPQKIVIIKSGDIIPDKRIQKRTEIGILPATISAKPMWKLLRTTEIEIKVVDLSEGGAQIWAKESLDEDKQYILSIILRNHKMSIPFEIRKKIGQRENTFMYGIHFTEISDTDKKIINRYLTKLSGDRKQKDIFSMDIKNALGDFKKSL